MENLKQLLSRDSFVIDELVIFETVKKWREYHGLDVDKITDVLDCVRLSEIPLEDIISTVFPSNLFSLIKIMDTLKKNEIGSCGNNPRGLLGILNINMCDQFYCRV